MRQLLPADNATEFYKVEVKIADSYSMIDAMLEPLFRRAVELRKAKLLIVMDYTSFSSQMNDEEFQQMFECIVPHYVYYKVVMSLRNPGASGTLPLGGNLKLICHTMPEREVFLRPNVWWRPDYLFAPSRASPDLLAARPHLVEANVEPRYLFQVDSAAQCRVVIQNTVRAEQYVYTDYIRSPENVFHMLKLLYDGAKPTITTFLSSFKPITSAVAPRRPRVSRALRTTPKKGAHTMNFLENASYWTDSPNLLFPQLLVQHQCYSDNQCWNRWSTHSKTAIEKTDQSAPLMAFFVTNKCDLFICRLPNKNLVNKTDTSPIYEFFSHLLSMNQDLTHPVTLHQFFPNNSSVTGQEDYGLLFTPNSGGNPKYAGLFSNGTYTFITPMLSLNRQIDDDNPIKCAVEHDIIARKHVYSLSVPDSFFASCQTNIHQIIELAKSIEGQLPADPSSVYKTITNYLRRSDQRKIVVCFSSKHSDEAYSFYASLLCRSHTVDAIVAAGGKLQNCMLLHEATAKVPTFHLKWPFTLNTSYCEQDGKLLKFQDELPFGVPKFCFMHSVSKHLLVCSTNSTHRKECNYCPASVGDALYLLRTQCKLDISQINNQEQFCVFNFEQLEQGSDVLFVLAAGSKLVTTHDLKVVFQLTDAQMEDFTAATKESHFVCRPSHGYIRVLKANDEVLSPYYWHGLTKDTFLKDKSGTIPRLDASSWKAAKKWDSGAEKNGVTFYNLVTGDGKFP